MLPGVGKGTLGSLWAFPNVCNQCEGLLACFFQLHVCHQHVGAYLRILTISGVCDKRAGASFRLLPTARVFDEHIHPLGFTPLQQVYRNTGWMFPLELFSLPQLFLVIVQFFAGIYIFFNFATRGPVLKVFCRQIIVFFSVLPPGIRAALPKMQKNYVFDCFGDFQGC